MGTNVVRSHETSVARADIKFEAVVIPVSDVDRAKGFYMRLGWRLDAHFRFDNGFRVVQFTPPGSGYSVQFGANITSALPGSAQGLYLVISRIEAAREDLVARAVEVVRGAGTQGRRAGEQRFVRRGDDRKTARVLRKMGAGAQYDGGRGHVAIPPTSRHHTIWKTGRNRGPHGIPRLTGREMDDGRSSTN